LPILHANGEITLKTTNLEVPGRAPEIGAEELTKLRLKNGISQAVLAQVLNVSTKTVQSWEQDLRKPSQAALRLIQVFRRDPSMVLEVARMSARNHGSNMGEEISGCLWKRKGKVGFADFNRYDVSTNELVWDGPAAWLERFGLGRLAWSR
jgi:putative transcriptional regulator